MDLRSTLNLPDTDFAIPMKANLPALEPQIQARWDAEGIYHRILEVRRNAPTFVLHDGPPYTNSPIHIGTAMNKILKDFVVKSRSMMGFRAPYVPGYDNHGLPIEQAVMKGFAAKKITPDIATLRQACRDHATKFIDLQTRQFKRLGVFGLWERPYATLDFKFEAEIVRVFGRMASLGYVYRGLRSTLWSPSSRTALADSEIVYGEHKSRAIFVRFPLLNDLNGFSKELPNFYTIIWTTTPWTIPANVAVAFHPTMEYSVVRVGHDHYLIAKDLLLPVMSQLGYRDFEVLYDLLGISMEGSTFKHPIFDRESRCVMAEYITADEGTGVVHTAPGHGRDDFATGLKYDLPILCPVNERGVLTEEAGEFAGTFYRDCDTVVVDRLNELGMLLKAYDYVHQYPYGERDGQPVIFRATEQWFISLDANDLREQMLSALESVEFFPPQGRTRMESMVATRPDWCISRQRPWGVGIPVFFGAESGQPVLDGAAIEAVAQLVEREGSDAWFFKDPAEILPAGYASPETGETVFRKETDVLDVWFDSGSTSLCVLEGNVEPVWKEPWPADLYLEGSDQHRGWFSSSLLLGTAIHGQAPYRQLVTHGFVDDDKGEKMSKRAGNIIDPDAACNKFGADIVRVWVAGVDYTNDAPCSDDILKQFGEMYRRIRNTLRFLHSNLYDFDPATRVELLDLDQWAMDQVDLLSKDCVESYERYEFRQVLMALHNFCASELSAFYLDAIKDRMYCDGADWPSRRSGQMACHYVLTKLVRLLTPIIPHTAEEVYQRIPGVEPGSSVHFECFDPPTAERLSQIQLSPLQLRFGSLFTFRTELNASFEAYKTGADLKDSQDACVVACVSSKMASYLEQFGDDLATILKFSEIELKVEADDSEESDSVANLPRFEFRASPYAKCERSRLRRPDVVEVNGVMLTARDRRAIGW